jgi:hypothetical protein
VFHLENDLLHFSFYELSNENVVLLLGYLSDIMNLIFYQCNSRNIKLAKEVLIILGDMTLKVGITDNNTLIILKSIY